MKFSQMLSLQVFRSVRWSWPVGVLGCPSELESACRSLIGWAGFREWWGGREGRSWRSQWATEGRRVWIQVGQLLLQPLNLSPEPPGLEIFSLPVSVGPVHDAPALAKVLLQGLAGLLFLWGLVG